MANTNEIIKLKNFVIGNNLPFTLIAGPCQLESYDHGFKIASLLKDITSKLDINFIFKTSFDKANRSSINSKRGLGLDRSLDALAKIKSKLDLPILTDIHEKEQCNEIKDVIDIIQIPAFLCRQTDLLVAAAKTGKIINVKKGQFLAPWDMKNIIDKISSAENPNILLTERGTSFGYNTLVSDFRALPIMKNLNVPVIFDATHSVQQPGGLGVSSGGQREFVPILSKAAIAIGVAALFIETHDNPDAAPSDGPNMLDINDMEALLIKLKAIDKLAKEI